MPYHMPSYRIRNLSIRGWNFRFSFFYAVFAKMLHTSSSSFYNGLGRIGLAYRNQCYLIRLTPRLHTGFFNALARGSYIATVSAVGSGGKGRSAPVSFTR